MRIENIAVGQPEDHVWNGKTLRTAIYKKSIPGPVMIRRHNVDGDLQASPSIHGGPYKAVYVYSADHYPWWREHLQRDVPLAMFGENLTVSGWNDAEACIGDVYRFGEAELEVAGPRLPCSKLAMKFGDPHMIKRFSDAGRWGLYHAVHEEGTVKVGDTVEKEQEMGRSGMTGMAGGDHLHFTMLVNGQMVNPVEWWDAHWIQDRIIRKLKEASGS